ncbi:MAG: hypothetical protein HOC70_15190 [Gammaproteobacteria bacterium]|nr:hypothetical protein [Gammaproteobacteria bacterium]MBT4494586.1 hypothetical protein [Gammaproteobacteria bacterium]MBT7369481.1 hypothetical protein [Gammaproteobacteria bacterium]
MAYRLSRFTGSPFYRVVAAQFFATFFASGLCLVIDKVAAISALSAGLSCIVPTIFVFAVSLRPISPGETGMSQVLRGEAGKFALTTAILAMVFVFVKPLNVVVFFGTFVLLQISQAVIPLLEARRLLKRS